MTRDFRRRTRVMACSIVRIGGLRDHWQGEMTAENDWRGLLYSSYATGPM
jgi:hypothetical protein